MTINNKFLLIMTLVFSISACGITKNDNGEPSHSWLYGESYGAKGADDATIATMAYSKGHFEKAEKHVSKSLKQNPRHPQSLMVGALTYEKLGRLNRARQYYEDLMIVGGEETTILGSESGEPMKMRDIARIRLNRIAQIQSQLLIENPDGSKSFNISKSASNAYSKTALEEALFVREQRNSYMNAANIEANVKAVEILFTENEKNIISRFLILKELAEKDLITKEEFINARETNIGGLLPLTKKAPALDIDSPVPSADVVIGRIDALKMSVEERAITHIEFSAERDMIVDAVLPKNPRARMKNKAPSREILEAAKDLRKLEVIYDLDLITASEKKIEENAINKNVKTASAKSNSSQKTVTKTAPKKLESIPTTIATSNEAPVVTRPQAIEKQVEIKGTMREYPVDPNVTSPFEK